VGGRFDPGLWSGTARTTHPLWASVGRTCDGPLYSKVLQQGAAHKPNVESPNADRLASPCVKRYYNRALAVISGGGSFYDFNLDFGCCFGTVRVVPQPGIESTARLSLNERLAPPAKSKELPTPECDCTPSG